MNPLARLGGSLLLALVAALSGCATPIDNKPQNVPTTPEFSAFAQHPLRLPGEHSIGLSLSGGGMRAAAFSFGVMLALTEAGESRTDVFDDISIISSVSGGSLTGAYLALRGRGGLATFRSEVLEKNLEADMRLSLFSVSNLMRLWAGGLNDRSNLAHKLDHDIFKGATFADLYRPGRPDLWINATDLYNRTPFPFIPPLFDGLCSDLSQLKVAEAVAASLAVPLAFAPVVLKTFPDQCLTELAPWVGRETTGTGSVTNSIVAAAAHAVHNYRDPARMRYVKLVDGGLSDNQGLASLMVVRAVSGTPIGPMTRRDAVRISRLLFLIVDAGRPPVGDWGMQLDGPSGLDVALAAADSAIDSATRLSAASFKVMVEAWQRDIVSFRCSLTRDQLDGFGGTPPDWRCDDVRFSIDTISAESLDAEQARRMRNMPTRLALPADDVAAAIAAGRAAALSSLALQRYVSDRNSRSPTP